MLGIDQIARLAAEEARKEQQIRTDGIIGSGASAGGSLAPNIVSQFSGNSRKIPTLGGTKDKVNFINKIIKKFFFIY